MYPVFRNDDRPPTCFPSFPRLYLTAHPAPASELRHRFDSDSNGSLDSTEFLAMLHMLGATMSPAEAEALVTRLDTTRDGSLEAAELLAWLRSAEFSATPLSYSLLAFLADGKRGLDELVNDVTRAVSSTGKVDAAGAAILAVTEGDSVVLADRGLKIFDRRTGLISRFSGSVGVFRGGGGRLLRAC